MKPLSGSVVLTLVFLTVAAFSGVFFTPGSGFFFVLLPVGLHGSVKLCEIFTDAFRALLVHYLARIRVRFQVGAVGIENASVRHFLTQRLLHNMVKNLLKDIAVVKTADTVLAESGGDGEADGFKLVLQ